MESEPLRDFADRFFRNALKDPENLREFLMDAAPTLAPGFDFSRVRLVELDFLLPNWHRREADIFFEIPYRSDGEEHSALVCVLIEHQSKPDPRMPLRMLLELVLFWERQWRTWEKAAAPKADFRLKPVLPIVLYTGARKWGSAQSLADLLGSPTAFHMFAPAWKPIIWELSSHSPEQLLNAEQAFIQVLTVVRMENEERDRFAQAFQDTLRKLEAIHGINRVRWTELVKLIFGWVLNRRPRDERQLWCDLGAATQENELRQEELKAMAMTLGKTIFEDGMEQHARHIIMMQGRKRFGEPLPEVSLSLERIEDLERLDRITLRILDASSWAELLETA